MKIFIDRTVAVPPFSGVQNAALRESEALQAAMPEDDIVQCGFGEGCTVEPPPPARKAAFRVLWQQAALPALLKKAGADALFSTAYTCPLRSPVPTVLHVHDTIALDRPELCSTLNALHMRALMPASIRRADRIIASSGHVASRIAALFPEAESKTTVLPLGVDMKRFSFRGCGLKHLPERYILFLGNLEPKKGLQVLLEAYPGIARATGLPLVVGGRAAWKSAGIRRRLAQWTGEGRVVPAGYIPDECLPGLYGNAALFVFPSIEEGLGLPVLEAMAAGTPVLHSDHPALLETAGGAGLAFRCGDAGDLSAKAIALLSSPVLCEKLRASGLARASSMGWDSFGKRLADIFRMLPHPS